MSQGPPVVDYELALLLIPVAASFLAWFWIGNMALIQGPGSSLGLLSALTVLSTAAIAAAEASKLGMGSSDEMSGVPVERLAAIGWFFFMVLLWIVAYPLYLENRRLFGLKNRCALGILIAIVFTGTVLFLGWGIVSAQNDLQQKLQDLQNSLNRLP